MSSNKASYKRLVKEYKAIKASPTPFIVAKPLETNILEWHYVLTGPPETPFEGGQYHGKLVFPDEYPFKPPSIRMITPSGRFEINTRLCLSISDFHPDSWNPAWSVPTILNGLLSFMNTDEMTTGSIKSSTSEKLKLAIDSYKFNFNNKKFRDVFPELIEEYEEKLANPPQSRINDIVDVNSLDNIQSNQSTIIPIIFATLMAIVALIAIYFAV